MSKLNYRVGATAALVAASLLMASSAATAQESEHHREVKVIVKKDQQGEKVVIRCEGEDCDEHRVGEKQVVFFDEDGNRQMPEGVHWVGADGDEPNVFVFKSGDKAFGARRAMLGVQLSELTDQLRATFGVPAGEGTMVSQVVEGSAAERAGLRAGDVITSVNGTAIGSARALAKAIGGLEDADIASLEVWRDGSVQRIDAQVEVKETAQALHGVHGVEGADVMRIHRRSECAEGDDCEMHVKVIHGEDVSFGDIDASAICGDASECRVQVQCEDGSCSCTVNGVAHDCQGIPGLPE